MYASLIDQMYLAKENVKFPSNFYAEMSGFVEILLNIIGIFLNKYASIL